jgi:hypothetical protein
MMLMQVRATLSLGGQQSGHDTYATLTPSVPSMYRAGLSTAPYIEVVRSTPLPEILGSGEQECTCTSSDIPPFPCILLHVDAQTHILVWSDCRHFASKVRTDGKRLLLLWRCVGSDMALWLGSFVCRGALTPNRLGLGET